MEIFFSTGEPSGDEHSAHLMDEIRRRCPDVRFSGFGGPEMEKANCQLLFRLTDLAVMFIWSVVPQLGTFYRLVQQAKRYFEEHRPDAVVLVDYPGFNWWIARKAKAAGIPVFYYLPPQLWAWGSWRVNKMRKFVDHILCGLAFEPEWYAKRGIQAEYVGHPFFDEIAAYQLDERFCQSQRKISSSTKTESSKKTDSPIVGVLPGSRNKEIERNWHLMIQVMQQLHAKHPNVRFVVASYNKQQRDRCVELFAAVTSGANQQLPMEFHIGKTSEIIDVADCCLMVSGSVSLELLARKTPAVVLYSINTITRFFKWLFLKVPYITLPNLMAGKAVYPEWLVCSTPQRDVQEMTAQLSAWLGDSELRETVIHELSTLRKKVIRTGATALTADAILQQVPNSQTERAA